MGLVLLLSQGASDDTKISPAQDSETFRDTLVPKFEKGSSKLSKLQYERRLVVGICPENRADICEADSRPE